MECPRCHGLMAGDHLTDMKDVSEAYWLPVWRCINCGELLDSCILEKRALRAAKPARMAETEAVQRQSAA